MTDFDKDTRDDLPGDIPADIPSELNSFFAAAKRETDDLSAGLMERILFDAKQVQEGIVVGVPDRPAAQGLFSGLSDLLGGWPAMAGLMTACTAGVWLGFSPPEALPDVFIVSSQLVENIDILDVDGLGANWNNFTESAISE